MEKEYSPKKIENYVQEYWKKNKTFEVKEDFKKEKYYCLPMLPYPSGKLHMGHVRNYTISDVIARYQRMLGKNVLQPMGWDAFGLPAEEAAIKNKTTPFSWTKKNIQYMKKQLQSLGFSYDWSREITTCHPEYYRWEQWFFTKLHEKKLVYKKNSLVNWCDYDKTVLANEQVINGCCWRCQNKIITKKIPQWFIKIRNYAESLYQDLKKLNHWPENVKNMQKNWIGRIKGFQITLNVFNTHQTLKVFINRLDLIMGVTHVSISACHELSTNISKNNKIIKNFIKKYKYISQEEFKKVKYIGINTDLFVIHPITEKKIPIWISNFTIKEYGTDAVLSIPGHNENDWYFAVKNNLKIKYVVSNPNHPESNSSFIDIKGKLFNSDEFNGLNFKDSSKKIKKILYQKKILKEKINYKLQDWCVSRQRYWGTPIPMATLKNGEIVSIPENNLPVTLPKIEKNLDLFKKPIDSNSNWAQILINSESAIRETDTFDTFIESSWYYARYTCPNFNTGMIDPIASKYWLPVDQYIGGIEHAIMHLMYFRFYHKLLRDFKLVDFDEPVKNLLCQGMVLSEAFYEIDSNFQRNWFHSSSVLIKRNAKGEIIKSCTREGKELVYAGMIKMSKSKNNGIEPELIIQSYGADTIRLFIMFSAPVESSLEWKESGVKGIYRFLKKLWKLILNYINIQNTHQKMNFNFLNDQQSELRYKLHKTIAKVSDDVSRRQAFNTAISSIMELVNQLIKAPIKEEQDKSIMRESLICIIKMLYPFTPHFCFFVWNYFNENIPIDNETWPVFQKDILSKKYHLIVIQINGKTRCTTKISNDLNKEKIVLHAQSHPIIKKYLKNINIKKIIHIPNKIINFVI
ncbi:leucyl-tRNA synthetase [Buchnera aphidicola str. Ak (Acyrthosiphon kondoi)]|uniref:Leucine--tRNA ligase n=1 Tax=Buchnera aphidicola str. Ak (Acyrthosiphon kondoi) TaxID=1005090 RepID=G2LNE4_9GAMM|nr:leucine--tRNA ligase [Buchnera aphidicola]AEO08782.1 leucyl-tRNA synthetase [Buchnera aphidicola str. Ak (Acyrthosiphon kondoi)]